MSSSTAPDDPARRRLAELLWYAQHNIALPDDELAEVERLAGELGVKLTWRHFVLGKVNEWREGRGNDRI